MTRLIRIEGMVDPHTHLRDLDWAYKATFTSETAAALAGGYWAVFDMPNTPPATTTRDALEHKRREIASRALCDWGVYFGAAHTVVPDYTAVVDVVCGLKIYCNATTGDLLIDDQTARERCFAAWPAERIIAVHAEEETVLDILQLVRRYRKRTHFVHVSSAREIAYLSAAKAEGLPVTLGVCPHHLYLTVDDLPALGAFGLMKPGLKTAADRAALWNALQTGIVDVVESDHAPHTIAEKQSAQPPYGVPGLETTLPLLLLAVSEGRLTLERIIELVAENPRRIWGLDCPPETYALVDLAAEWTIDRSRLHSACGWSPFEGMRVKGMVRETWIRGQRAYADGETLVPAGFGRDIFGSGVV